MNDKAEAHIDDLIAIGRMIVEAADRVSVMHSVMPGCAANLHFEMDGRQFSVAVKVDQGGTG